MLCLGLFSKWIVSSARPLAHNADLNKAANETLACVLVSASVSCWEVFQATVLKYLHTADDITLQINRNETTVWTFVSGNLFPVYIIEKIYGTLEKQAL